MSLQWADFPSGQRGMYGRDSNYMLEGTPWVNIESAQIVADPDPTFPEGNVLRNDSSTSGDGSACRLALSTPHAMVGVAFRFYNVEIDGVRRAFLAILTAGNGRLYTLHLNSNGSIALFRNLTQIDVTSGPAIYAGSWNHLEFNINVATGVYELRKEGVNILSGTDGSPPGGTVGLVGFPSRASGGAGWDNMLSKDIIVYNGAGSVFNSFLGSVFVNDIYEDSDEDLGGWTTSDGGDGFPLIADTELSNTLYRTSAIANLDVVRINNTYYRFTSGSVDSGSPAGTSANPWLVALGGTDPDSLSNLYKAIGATGVAGTTYSTALVAHTTVTALGVDNSRLSVTPTNGTTTTMTFSETSSGMFWGSTTGFAYGPVDATYIAADDSPPAPAQFTLTELDPDVTSVRAVMSIIRAYKTDGGDGTLQVDLTPDGINYDAGTDRAVTTTPTFYWDISELSPATAAPWTPAEVNAAMIRFDRTT